MGRWSVVGRALGVVMVSTAAGTSVGQAISLDETTHSRSSAITGLTGGGKIDGRETYTGSQTTTTFLNSAYSLDGGLIVLPIFDINQRTIVTESMVELETTTSLDVAAYGTRHANEGYVDASSGVAAWVSVEDTGTYDFLAVVSSSSSYDGNLVGRGWSGLSLYSESQGWLIEDGQTSWRGTLEAGDRVYIQVGSSVNAYGVSNGATSGTSNSLVSTRATFRAIPAPAGLLATLPVLVAMRRRRG